MENPNHRFREKNFVLDIKSQNVNCDELELAKEKRQHPLYRLFCPLFAFYPSLYCITYY